MEQLLEVSIFGFLIPFIFNIADVFNLRRLISFMLTAHVFSLGSFRFVFARVAPEVAE